MRLLIHIERIRRLKVSFVCVTSPQHLILFKLLSFGKWRSLRLIFPLAEPFTSCYCSADLALVLCHPDSSKTSRCQESKSSSYHRSCRRDSLFISQSGWRSWHLCELRLYFLHHTTPCLIHCHFTLEPSERWYTISHNNNFTKEARYLVAWLRGRRCSS